ncbi:MAG: hypothetical protein JST87_13725 [Bacteroidetes bacterium]|nr:hypothetical protein [Bacteroidota bacterium]
MADLPIYIRIVFIITTLLTIFLFYRATQNMPAVLLVLMAWITLQAVVSKSDFYTITNNFPPRFMLLVVPPLLLIIILFVTKPGRKFIDRLDIKTLTLMHTLRILVEIVLFWLFLYKTIPELMTFEGRNFDILAGLSAPFIYYFGFVKKAIGNKVLIAWNIICLLLLFNIVINAVLSAPFPFQQFAFDQPNIAILYFPFVWLPCCIVPLVLFSHLATMRQLLK